MEEEKQVAQIAGILDRFNSVKHFLQLSVVVVVDDDDDDGDDALSLVASYNNSIKKGFGTLLNPPLLAPKDK